MPNKRDWQIIVTITVLISSLSLYLAFWLYPSPDAALHSLPIIMWPMAAVGLFGTIVYLVLFIRRQNREIRAEEQMNRFH